MAITHVATHESIHLHLKGKQANRTQCHVANERTMELSHLKPICFFILFNNITPISRCLPFWMGFSAHAQSYSWFPVEVEVTGVKIRHFRFALKKT